MRPGKTSEQPAAGLTPTPSTAAPLAASTPTGDTSTPSTVTTTTAASSSGANRVEKSPVKMEGYLEKKGKMRVVAIWKRYWFVLEGRLLLYYKSQQEYTRLSPCRGSLNMGLASCVRPGAGPDQHVLEVVLRSHVVSLRAKDRTCQEQWLKALLDSMASSSSATSPGKDQGNGKGPLHFRYPSADNLNKAEHESVQDDQDATSCSRKEKHHTLPNWTRTPSTEPQLGTVPERASNSNDTPDGAQAKMPEGVHVAPRKTQADKKAGITLARQGSILPILGKKDKSSSHSSPRAVHPLSDRDLSPFGNQRYSFHGVRKGDQINSIEGSVKSKEGKELPVKPKGYKNFESVLKKQLSFSSPSNDKDTSLKKATQISEESAKTKNGSEINHCRYCKRPLISEKEKCNCLSTPVLEEEKENLMMKWQKCTKYGTPTKFHPDENQNQLFRDSSFDLKRMNIKLGRNHSGSEKDLLLTSGVDLSFVSPNECEFPKPVRCTSADELWSPPRKNLREIYVKRSKLDHLGSDAQYFSASEIHNPSHTLDSHKSEPVASEKNKLVKLPLRQRLIHGNGEYIKYSEPEDCDKRDSTFNTTSDSHSCDTRTKQPKMRLRKRKGSNSKDSYNLTDTCDDGNKKRSPVRNRMSFLTRVLSHVRRTKSEDIMDHPESEGIFSDDAFLSPHPDVRSKCATPVSRLLDDVKEMENAPNGSNTLRAHFQLGPSNPVFGEAPEEPPPDYDSVGVDQVTNSAGCSMRDEPPQLPPRRMKRPRSPWHDVPTNNSPVIDMDPDARQRLLSAAKYGRVIGTRTSHSMDFYDWSDSHQSDHSQHHAYEIVSDDTSPAGSNEHLAIYLSSESSDEEFHEEVVLRRNLQDREFLFGTQNPFGNIVNSSAMEPLTISTNVLPTLDSNGRVGLSHVEAMKLNLLMQAQRTSTESIRRQREERDRQECSNVVTNLDNKLIEDFYQVSDECLQQPPEQFADKEESAECKVNKATEKVMEEVKGLLSPIEKLLHSCSDFSNGNTENICIPKENGVKLGNKETPSLKENEDEPPRLPTKKMKNIWKSDETDQNSRHTDELNDLLAQLAGMTTAPLLPIGTTCSLQIDAINLDNDIVDAVNSTQGVVRKQSLSLNAVSNMYDSEPDYDVPRPHSSLLHILPQNGMHFPNCRSDDDGIVVEATHFFSRPESPRHGVRDDHSLSGHMSPDSLDFPFTSKRSAHWDACYSYSGKAHEKAEKMRPKKDRSRRATLNGPISQHPSALMNPQAPLIRRNSMELPTIDIEMKKLVGSKMRGKERGLTEPKQVKKLSDYETATCEHNSTTHPSLSLNHSPCLGNGCKKLEVSSSLDDISEKSELNSESVPLKPESSISNQIGSLTKSDDLDMDSLEVSEFKKVDIPESAMKTLVPIIEELDTSSDKNDSHTEGTNGLSSDSASEGAVMIGGTSNSSATDQHTNHNTDTDMEMPSDDELGQSKDQMPIYDDMGKIIEPDSLLLESCTVEKAISEEMRYMTETDSTKDASLETDSLELKK